MAEGELPGSLDKFLECASERAASDPIMLPVRMLISYWGAAGRGYRVVGRIRKQLRQHNLRTEPDFASGHIDNYVRVTLLPEPRTDTSGDTQPGEVALLVRSLRAATQGVKSVTPQSSLEEAISLMLLHDYSQLAVLSGVRYIQGAVSWDSIAKSRLARETVTLKDAVVAAHVVEQDDALLPLLPRIADAGYVFVRSRDRSLSGIVTTADITLEFGALAGPYFLLGEIERRLRRVIDRSLQHDVVAAAKAPGDDDRRVENVDDLTLGELIRILEDRDNWRLLNWTVDRNVFVGCLHRLKEVRNNLLHFSPDLPTEGEIAEMRNTLNALQVLDS